MKRNMGQIDRIIRIVIGVVIALLGVVNHSWWGAVAVVPFLTAVIGFCPLYTVLKISTCSSCCSNDKPGKNTSCNC